MGRMVYRKEMGPIKIDPKTLDPEKAIWICACGLSQTFPFCDKAHKLCQANEKPGVLYVYSKDNKTVVEELADPVGPAPTEPPPSTPGSGPAPNLPLA